MLVPMTIAVEPSPRMRETPIEGEQARVAGLISLFHLPFLCSSLLKSRSRMSSSRRHRYLEYSYIATHKSILAKTAQDGNRRSREFVVFRSALNSALTASCETCKMRGASI
jgi:hypothetical protein